MPPTISVVTPSFNQAKFLEETLRSVLAQRDQIHEYFVIDGGSTDGSTDIIRRYDEQQGGGIDYWESTKDQGQADAINKGFARCTGDFLCWLNSDDVFLPGALTKVRKAFEDHPHWDVLTAWHVRIDAESRILTARRVPGDSPSRARWGPHNVCQQTCFFRRSLYEKVGPLDLQLHCALDLELWYRMWDAGSTWGHIPDYLAGYREHPSAKTSSWQKQFAIESVWMNQRYPQYNADTLKHRTGLRVYRAMQLLSGRHFLAKRDTQRWRGKLLSDVFGDNAVSRAQRGAGQIRDTTPIGDRA
jgi:glycosyltransferase involved in cell wall biosynthesis